MEKEYLDQRLTELVNQVLATNNFKRILKVVVFTFFTRSFSLKLYFKKICVL